VTNEEDPDSCATKDGKSCGRVGDCKVALGVAATDPSTCASGFIVDGVCCSTSSCGTCQACRADLKTSGDEVPGVCTATKAGLDPRDECSVDEVATCGHNGACDGDRACQLYAKGTSCGPNAAVCTGAGRCLLPTAAKCSEDLSAIVEATGNTITCAPYLCENALCRDSCKSRTDCFGDSLCTEEGKCVAYTATLTPTDPGCSASPQTSFDRNNLVSAAGALFVFSLAAQRRAQRRTCRRARKPGDCPRLRRAHR